MLCTTLFALFLFSVFCAPLCAGLNMRFYEKKKSQTTIKRCKNSCEMKTNESENVVENVSLVWIGRCYSSCSFHWMRRWLNRCYKQHANARRGAAEPLCLSLSIITSISSWAECRKCCVVLWFVVKGNALGRATERVLSALHECCSPIFCTAADICDDGNDFCRLHTFYSWKHCRQPHIRGVSFEC